uniref:Vesicle transport protein n=1 Tax=Rhizochromulina marina TaxID=1034831 RepID=A0A7S2W1V2_9STRA|mmetsp:Transcript_11189/g.32149  ORF Transcript_11189/g.32149 Transcript_11189/m.32149 type:complete len:243 (+) Transcript_11189:99-827(+)|eukprot:CAMPEP_0118984096 /NCGR_PEP_ID=MMETSP1173-20130426/37104_1 /TAXON_ID=1034831 /ORGANISM="Rhizochromulina marina cf, Strain CCMP1243" /LENGTH=242 /DNA_ID=CAMNT_0006934739 /DNA_START=14 /DNA_END=742 /DNA_ORIENTATION=+
MKNMFQQLGLAGEDEAVESATSVEMTEDPFRKAWASAASTVRGVAESAKSTGRMVAEKAGVKLPPDPQEAEDDTQGLMNEATDAMSEAGEELKALCPKLTLRQRIYGAAACVAIGFTLDFMASLAFLGGKAHVADYAVLYTLGNVTAIAGSAFVVGPARQCRLMFKPVRRISCVLFLCCMVATIIVAIFYPVPVLILLILAIQYCALVWYGASFIPFGRRCIVACCKRARSSAAQATGLDEL